MASVLEPDPCKIRKVGTSRIDEGQKIHLGLIKYTIMKAIANKKHNPPTVRYAVPRKSFFPPSQLAVESTSFFLPLKL